MTLRRYAPLALSALALACQPKLDERANATTVDYAYFDPGASLIPPNAVVPMPNDIALSKVDAFLPGRACGSAPCNTTGPCNTTADPQVMGLCAYARAGGFPAATPLTINFVRGTLSSDGTVTGSFPPLAESFDIATLSVVGTNPAPNNIAIVDYTNFSVPAIVGAGAGRTFDPTAGTLTLHPTWTAGHKYVVLVRGGASGVLTATSGAFVATPTFYIVRESALSDRSLLLPENQGLFPGDAAAKAAAGAGLEPLRVGYANFIPLAEGLGLPFGELVAMQTLTIAPGGTITIGDGTDPADAAVTGGAVAPLDAFTLSSTVSSATVQAVTFALTEGDAALTNLFVSSSATCTGTGTTLGTSGAPAVGDVPIPLTNWLSVGNVSSVTLYVCATTKAPGAATNVSGAVTSVTTFAGTGFTSTGTDTSAVLTVNP